MNEIYLSGEVIAPVQQIPGSDLYQTTLKVIRRSAYEDKIPVLMRKEYAEQINEGDKISLLGKINSRSAEGHLLLGVYIQKYTKISVLDDQNMVGLEGYICQVPNYRMTPMGRQITDLFIAVQRHEYTTDYIPCIAWGKGALYASTLPIASKVRAWGRIQSREYLKRYEDGNEEVKTAYEVSISKLELVELPQRKECEDAT